MANLIKHDVVILLEDNRTSITCDGQATNRPNHLPRLFYLNTPRPVAGYRVGICPDTDCKQRYVSYIKCSDSGGYASVG